MIKSNYSVLGPRLVVALMNKLEKSSKVIKLQGRERVI
jgi:hypothetical protein